jgi:hypothetical protein
LVGRTEGDARTALLEGVGHIMRAASAASGGIARGLQRKRINHPYRSQPPFPGLATVFISYRRTDNARDPVTDLHRALVERLPQLRIFIDLSGIKGGTDFRQEIYCALENVTVLIVAIGKSWSGRRGDDRIKDSTDYVRKEVAEAIKSKALVLPVLLEKASMPVAARLPNDLKSIVVFQAQHLSRASFTTDVDALVQRMLVVPTATYRYPGTGDLYPGSYYETYKE